MALASYRALDANGDYTWGAGLANFLTGAPAVGQMIKTRLLLWLGQWFLDTTDGLPMMQGILGYSGSNKATIDRLLVNRISATLWQGQNVVTNISNLSSSYDITTRKYSFSATVQTIYGAVTITNISTQPTLGSQELADEYVGAGVTPAGKTSAGG